MYDDDGLREVEMATFDHKRSASQPNTAYAAAAAAAHYCRAGGEETYDEEDGTAAIDGRSSVVSAAVYMVAKREIHEQKRHVDGQ